MRLIVLQLIVYGYLLPYMVAKLSRSSVPLADSGESEYFGRLRANFWSVRESGRPRDPSVHSGLAARRRELRRTAASIKTYRATCTHLMVRGMLLRWVGRVVMITQMDCVE